MQPDGRTLSVHHPTKAEPRLEDLVARLEAAGMTEWRLTKVPNGYVMSAREYAQRGVRWVRAAGRTPGDAVEGVLSRVSAFRGTSVDVRCSHCARPVHLTSSRDWVHHDGGRFVMHCEQCGYEAATDPLPAACPKCGETREWKLEHPAMPAPVMEIYAPDDVEMAYRAD